MAALTWKKLYKGPFSKREAQVLSKELRGKANPNVNGIHDVRIRSRRQNQGYDIYINIRKGDEQKNQ